MYTTPFQKPIHFSYKMYFFVFNFKEVIPFCDIISIYIYIYIYIFTSYTTIVKLAKLSATN